MLAFTGDRAAATTGASLGGRIEVAVRDRRGVPVVAPAGDLDIYTAWEFWRHVEPLTARRSDVIVDLRDVGLLDSAGLGALVSLRNRLARDGRLVGVACAHLRRVVSCAGLEAAFVCERELDGVLERLARARGAAR